MPMGSIARLFLQFEVNMTTNVDVKLLKDGEVVREDTKLKDTKTAVHNLKFEAVVAEEKYKGLMNETRALKEGTLGVNQDQDLGSFKSLLHNFDLKLIDIDSFAKGNPILKGL